MNTFAAVFAVLEASDVRYLLVGGLATVLHGHTRMTSDVDLVIDLSRENCSKAINALIDAGFAPRAPVDPMMFADGEVRRSWVKDKGLIVFSMYGNGDVPIEVDIFSEYPFDFESAWASRLIKTIYGIEIPILDRVRLIEMKERIGRPVDLEDAKALRMLDDGS